MKNSIFASSKPSGNNLFSRGDNNNNPFKGTSSTASGASSIFGDSSKDKKSTNPFQKAATQSSLFSSGTASKSPFQTSSTMGGGSGGGTALFQTKPSSGTESPFKTSGAWTTSKPSGGLFTSQTGGAKDSIFKSSMSSGKSSTYSYPTGSNPYAAKTQIQEQSGPPMVQSALTPAMIVDMIKSKDFEPNSMLKDLNPTLAELPDELVSKFKAYFDTTYKNFETLFKIQEQAQVLDKELDDTIHRTKEEGAELLTHLQSHDKMETKLQKSQEQVKKLEEFSSQTHLIVKGLAEVEEVPSQDFTDFWSAIFQDYRANLKSSDASLKAIERAGGANELLDNNCEMIKEELATAIESISLEQKALLELNMYFKSKVQGLGPMKNWVLQKEGKIPTQKKNLKGRDFLVDLAEQIVAKKNEAEHNQAPIG